MDSNSVLIGTAHQAQTYGQHSQIENNQQSSKVMVTYLMREGCIISEINSDCGTLKKKLKVILFLN